MAENGRGAPSRNWTRDYLNRAARSGELAQAIGVAPASAQAQRQGGGIGVENIRRGVGRAVLGPGSANLTVSATAAAALPTPLELEMWLSGRPLEVTLTGIWGAGTSGSMAIDVLLRGTSISGAVNGLAFTNTTAILPFTGTDIVMAPAPGLAKLEVHAFRATADGTIFTDANNRLALLAREL